MQLLFLLFFHTFGLPPPPLPKRRKEMRKKGNVLEGHMR